MEQPLQSFVRKTIDEKIERCSTCSDAIRCMKSAATSDKKSWVLLPWSDEVLKEFDSLLKDSETSNCGIVLATETGPVSPMTALEVSEIGKFYTAALVLASNEDSAAAAEALREAAMYTEGPAVVFLTIQAAVQEGGAWVNFTYDPRREVPLLTKKNKVREDIQSFIHRDNLLTLIARKTLAKGSEGETGGASGGGAGSFSSVRILYTSDTGHGEEIAKKIARQCRNNGFASSAVQLGTMDSFDAGALSKEPLVIFVVSTAGKGEFPGNGRNFWNKLQSRTDLKGQLSGVQYTVFGLGDSHYWGKGTEDSKINFAKPACDLDGVLEAYGAQRLIPVGFGDDQDPDAYHTGYGQWTGVLYPLLGVEDKKAEVGDDEGPVKPDEQNKCTSIQLRGTLKESLDVMTTAKLPSGDSRLIKFHGCQQQIQTSLNDERATLGLESAYSFMLRARFPGGVCTPQQWLELDSICERYASKNPTISPGQTFQLNGIAKRDVKATIRAMNRLGMDTLGTCGDVCRNVACTADPTVCSRQVMDQILSFTSALNNHCLPGSGAYHEIFLMNSPETREKSEVSGCLRVEEEPLYGMTYLPKKLSVAVAIPPNNDVDIFAHACGFIAIIEGGALQGFNVTFGNHVVGFCSPDRAKHVLEEFLVFSRQYGNRVTREDVVEEYGAAKCRQFVEEQLGHKLDAAREYVFERSCDFSGWSKEDQADLWHCSCVVPEGYVKGGTRVGLAKIAEELRSIACTFRMTCNQQVVISGIPTGKKETVQQLLKKYNLQESEAGMKRRGNKVRDSGSDSECSTESGPSARQVTPQDGQ
jgi:sulfite reductase (NADPH) hemoprotein beta-component